MGRFRIEIQAVGGHGDRREIGDGGSLAGFEDLPERSIDKVAFDAVESLKKKGASIESARIVHWPGQDSEVVDDLVEQTRHGSF